MFFGFSKNVKKMWKKRSHLVMQPLITQLPEVGTRKSRSPTSNILLRSADTRNYATENCVWWMPISIHNIPEFWGQNFYRHSAKLILFVTLRFFLKRAFKKRKKSCFLKSGKNVKYVFSNADLRQIPPNGCCSPKSQGCLDKSPGTWILVTSAGHDVI